MNGTVAGNERQVAWISEFADEDVCTTAELISCVIKNNITDGYIHKCNGRSFREQNDIKL